MPGSGEHVSSQASLARSRRRLLLLGPAFVTSIAYVDPGNVAANLTAGARYGYLLLWVLLLANATALAVQYLSAKLGIVVGRSLPELVGMRVSRPSRLLFWAQAELIAAATDLAEVIGGAIALNLLFELPLPVGGLIVGLVSLALLGVQSRRGQRPFEFIIMALLGVIITGFLAGILISPLNWPDALRGVVPRFSGRESLLLATSMFGATVMPHAIYLHSALTRDRHGVNTDFGTIRQLLSATRWDVTLALGLAGAVNVVMLVIAAANLSGAATTSTVQGAHAAITTALGTAVGVAFAVGLLASGLASTSIGCYAGSTIMADLLRRQVPTLLRRSVTLVPAIAVLVIGLEPTRALVLSQALLSMGVPFALVPLVHYTGSRRIMGAFVNGPLLATFGWAMTGAVVALNLALLYLTMTGDH